MVQLATSNVIEGKVEAVRRTSIDVSGGELAIISRVERSLVLGGVRNLTPNDSVSPTLLIASLIPPISIALGLAAHEHGAPRDSLQPAAHLH